MNLDVPVYSQAKDVKDCGPAALKMILSYFGEDIDINKITDLSDPERSGVVPTVGLAKAAAQLGFKVELYTSSLEVDSKNFELEFYKKEASSYLGLVEKAKRLLEELTKYGGKAELKRLELGEILSKINKDCVPLILLNWNTLFNLPDFQGHFVPITGYDDEFIFVNDPDVRKPGNKKIPRALFDKSRKSQGTDEDIIFIHRKRERGLCVNTHEK